MLPVSVCTADPAVPVVHAPIVASAAIVKPSEIPCELKSERVVMCLSLLLSVLGRVINDAYRVGMHTARALFGPHFLLIENSFTLPSEECSRSATWSSRIDRSKQLEHGTNG